MPETSTTHCIINIPQEITSKVSQKITPKVSQEITPEVLQLAFEQFKLSLNTLSEITNLENKSDEAKKNLVSKKKLILYIVTYVFATINLLGITQSIDLNNPIDALKKISLIIGASLAPGFTYLGGMQELIEAAENYFGKLTLDDRNRKTYVLSLLNKIKASLAEASWKDYFKTSVIGTLAAFSSFLDATNAQSGVEAIAGKTAGIIAGIGNGIAEGILPLFTLPQLFNSIVHDFQRIKMGAYDEQKELGLAVETIKKFLEDIPREDILVLKNQFSRMKKSERSAIKKLMEKIQQSDQFAKQLQLGNINVKDVASSDAYTRIIACGRILANSTLSYTSAWAFSRVFSSNQIVEYYERNLNNFNLTLENISLVRNNTNLAIEPFNPYINTLNQFSYGLIGIAFLPLIMETFQEIYNLLQFILGRYDRSSINLKKAAFAFTIAMTGTACYSILGLEAANSYQTLQRLLEIEEFEVPQLPFFPDFDFLSIPAILILVSILYGGASNAVKKLYDALPDASACFCKATTKNTIEKKSRRYYFFSEVKTQNPKEENIELSILPTTNSSVEANELSNQKFKL